MKLAETLVPLVDEWTATLMEMGVSIPARVIQAYLWDPSVKYRQMLHVDAWT